MKSELRPLHGWGRFRPADAVVYSPGSASELAASSLPAARLLARGLGRSYGDAAQLERGNVVDTTACRNVEWVDRLQGLIRADAGVTIGQLIDRFVPKGWFVPVSPGTRKVTIGGAIAADVHGKNHHVDGSFGAHVRSMRLRLASDELVEVSPESDPSLFWATLGGMGLTGIVVDAVIGLTPIPTSTVRVETERLASLEPLLRRMRASDDQHAFSVAWVDLLGGARSVLTQGSFATEDQRRQLAGVDAAGRYRRPLSHSIAVPAVPLPRLAITPGVRAFNELWWRRAPATRQVTGQSITSFFHPLDAIGGWNRIYGPGGFVQWQCVVPDDSGSTATGSLGDIVDRLATLPAYFTVLKRFGEAGPGPLSFPMPGWTLAVDLPATDEVLGRLDGLDHIVADAGGRIYLAKDARLARAPFEQMYPDVERFRDVRARVDPSGRFLSDLAVRLGL